MKAIWKYNVALTDEFTVTMPVGASSILSVQVQDGQPRMWALVSPDAAPRPRHFRLAGTGHPIDTEKELRFIGTIQLNDGALVFHLFEVLAR
jgi:hypothetical protein